MADQKISAMPSANVPLTGGELIPMVQSGVNVQSTLSAFGDYARENLFNYGDFAYSDGIQIGTANQVKSILFNITGQHANVDLGSPASNVVVSVAGIYSVIISLQLSNTDANFDNFTMWPVVNNVAIPSSASVTSCPAKKGSQDGLAILTVQYTLAFAAGGILRFDYYSPAGTTGIITFPLSLVTPIHPAASGAILSVIQVAA